MSDETKIALVREDLLKAFLIEQLFNKFEGYFIRNQGQEIKGDQIIDATIIPVLIRVDSREEINQIKRVRIHEELQECFH
jgi:hypothetical protein